MDEKKYTIILEDGSIIKNLKMNGNNFVSKETIVPEMFDGNLGIVIINDGEIDEKHENMELIQVSKMGEEYWFILRDMPELDIAILQLRAATDYLSMMTNIEI